MATVTLNPESFGISYYWNPVKKTFVFFNEADLDGEEVPEKVYEQDIPDNIRQLLENSPAGEEYRSLNVNVRFEGYYHHRPARLLGRPEDSHPDESDGDIESAEIVFTVGTNKRRSTIKACDFIFNHKEMGDKAMDCFVDGKVDGGDDL